MPNRLCVALAMHLFLTGCVTTWTPEPTRLKPASPVPISKPMQAEKANVGEFMITSWSYQSVPELHAESEVKFAVEGTRTLLGTFQSKAYNFEVTVPVGKAVLQWRDSQGTTYYRSKELLQVDSGDKKIRGVGGFSVSPKQPEKATAFWVPYFRPGHAIRSQESTAYQIDDGEISQVEFDGFSQTITYLGLVGQELRFVYKEFNDRVIRDPFTQNFSLDYKPEFEYSFKNARFVVHEATPNDISYTVTSSFQ